MCRFFDINKKYLSKAYLCNNCDGILVSMKVITRYNGELNTADKKIFFSTSSSPQSNCRIKLFLSMLDKCLYKKHS